MTGWRIAVKQVNLRNKAISFWPSEQKKRLSSSSPSLVDKRKTGFLRMGLMVPGGGPEPPQSFWPLGILSPTHSFSKLPILLQLQAFTFSSAMGSGGFYMVLHGANGQSLGRAGGVVGVMAIFQQLWRMPQLCAKVTFVTRKESHTITAYYAPLKACQRTRFGNVPSIVPVWRCVVRGGLSWTVSKEVSQWPGR